MKLIIKLHLRVGNAFIYRIYRNGELYAAIRVGMVWHDLHKCWCEIVMFMWKNSLKAA